MKAKKKHWYDYLWIWTIVYFTLGFFNILFAWLGMIDFLLSIIIAVFGGNKFFCNHLCGRGQLYCKLGGNFKCSRNKPSPLLIDLIVMIFFKARTWCAFCPMGTMTQAICKLKHREKWGKLYQYLL